MNYQEAKDYKAKLEAAHQAASAVMQQFPRGAMGLIPDHIKATLEYKAAKQASDAAFQQLRNFNGLFVKTFKKQIMAERRIKQ